MFLRGVLSLYLFAGPVCGMLLIAASAGPPAAVHDAPSLALVPAAEASDAPVGRPERLRMAHLGIDAPVTELGPDAGILDLPNDTERIGWYAPGTKPGEPGNAVLAGGLEAGAKRRAGVFARLKELQIGDVIAVIDEGGTERRFLVLSRETYVRDTAPVEALFGASDRPRLNLVTGAGRWDWRKKSFDSRLVVSAEAVLDREAAGP